jgi:hypothetical protein
VSVRRGGAKRSRSSRGADDGPDIKPARSTGASILASTVSLYTWAGASLGPERMRLVRLVAVGGSQRRRSSRRRRHPSASPRSSSVAGSDLPPSAMRKVFGKLAASSRISSTPFSPATPTRRFAPRVLKEGDTLETVIERADAALLEARRRRLRFTSRTGLQVFHGSIVLSTAAGVGRSVSAWPTTGARRH